MCPGPAYLTSHLKHFNAFTRREEEGGRRVSPSRGVASLPLRLDRLTEDCVVLRYRLVLLLTSFTIAGGAQSQSQSRSDVESWTD